MGNISDQNSSYSLDPSEINAIKNYMNDTETPTDWKGRLVITDDGKITYNKTIQSTWDRILRFIGVRTETANIKEIGKKKIQNLKKFDTIDPRFLLLFKLHVGNNKANMDQNFENIIYTDFVRLMDTNNVTLQELHPYIQTCSSEDIAGGLLGCFEADPKKYFNFLSKLYNTAKNDGRLLLTNMVSSFKKLLSSIPENIRNNAQYNQQFQGLETNIAQHVITAKKYETAVVTKDFEGAGKIIDELPNVARTRLISSFIKSQSSDKELLILFSHFPKGAKLPDECIEKAEKHFHKALHSKPKNYDTAKIFLAALSIDKQSKLMKEFMNGATGSNIKSLINDVPEKSVRLIFQQLDGIQLVNLFKTLSEDESNQYQTFIVEQFQKIATTTGFPDRPLSYSVDRLQGFKSLIDFIPKEIFLTTNWMQSKALEGTGPESFFMMLDKLFECEKLGSKTDPQEKPQFNFPALQQFRDRLINSSFILNNDGSHRDSAIKNEFNKGVPIFGNDETMQYKLYLKIEHSLNQIVAKNSQQDIRLISNRQYLQSLFPVEYLETLFGNSAEVLAHSIMVEEMRRGSPLGYVVRNYYIGKLHDDLVNSEDILQHLPHELLVNNKDKEKQLHKFRQAVKEFFPDSNNHGTRGHWTI